MRCPRCQADKKHLRTEHEGREDGKLVWTVYYCQRCSFTWRDSEPADSLCMCMVLQLTERKDWIMSSSLT